MKISLSELWKHAESGLSVASSLSTIIPFTIAALLYIYTLGGPSTQLVADIYPSEFRFPTTLDSVIKLTQTVNRPMDQDIVTLLRVSGANGASRIDLHNDTALPIDNIHVRVSGATVYIKGTPNTGDSVVIPSEEDKGIVIKTLEQGSTITLYVWASMVYGSYSDWAEVQNEFQITYPTGVAEKRYHIRVGRIAETIDRHLILFVALFGVVFLAAVAMLATRIVRFVRVGSARETS